MMKSMESVIMWMENISKKTNSSAEIKREFFAIDPVGNLNDLEILFVRTKWYPVDLLNSKIEKK